MIELVAFGLVVNDARPFANGMDTAQVGGGVQGGIRRFCDGDFGDRGRQATALVAGGSQGSRGGASTVGGGEGVLFIAVTLDGVLGVFAFEEAHCGRWEEGKRERKERSEK